MTGMPHFRVLLGAGVRDELEDEELPFLTDLHERRRRGEQLDKMKVFLTAVVEREADLRSLLEWLTDTHDSLKKYYETTEDSRDVISTKLVENMEKKLEKSMSDINRLYVLAQNLFGVEIKKTKKETAAQKKCEWRWWREKKVDVRTVKRIQKLQPPSADKFLADAQLANNSSADLIFMLNDIAECLSCNKAMNMAFRFVEMGLQNLNQAFQDRTKEAKSLQGQLDEMNRNDCRFEMAQVKMQMDDGNKRISELEEELACMKEQNEVLLSQIHEMSKVQETTLLRPQAAFAHQQKEADELKPSKNQSALSTEVMFSKPRRNIQKEQLDNQNQQIQCPTTEDQTSFIEDDLPDESHQYEWPKNTENLVEHVEKKSADLLQDFQMVTLNLIDVCFESLPENKKELTILEEQRGKLNSDHITQLYCTLQNTIRDYFNKIVNNVQEKFTDDIIEMPLTDRKLPELEFWDSTKRSPGDMLRVISEEIPKQNETLRDAGGNLLGFIQEDGDVERQQNSLTILSNQFKSINEMGKRQVCNIQPTLGSLQEMQFNMEEREKTAVQEQHRSLFQSPISMPQLSCTVPLPSQMKSSMMRSFKEVVGDQPDPKIQRESVLGHKPEKTITVKPTESVVLMDFVESYSKSIEEEGERLLQTQMRGIKFVINVESQRLNLRLLHQAMAHTTIPSNLYCLAKDLIIDTLGSVKQRLVCLFRRFIMHVALQKFRRTLDAQFQLAQDTKNGKALKGLYCYLQRVGHFQHTVTSRWCAKQLSIDKRRRTCIAQMTYLFQQLRKDYSLQLAVPYACNNDIQLPLLSVIPYRLHWVPNFNFIQRPRPVWGTTSSGHPPSPLSDTPYQHMTRKGGIETQNLQQVTTTPPSMWPTGKTPGAPAQCSCLIPRLLDMEVNRERIRAMHTLQARSNGDECFLHRSDLMKN